MTGYHKGPIGGSRSRDGRIQELQLDGKGGMWIATGDGIDLFDPVSGEYREFLPNGQAPGKSMFTRMSADSTGILWISTADDGLYLLPPASFRFAHYALRGPSGWPMEMETIDRWDDGSYWIGTEGKVANIRLEDLSVLRVVDLFKGRKADMHAPASGPPSTKGMEHCGTAPGDWGSTASTFKAGASGISGSQISRQVKH